MDGVDNRDECVGPLEWIGGVVRFGCWEIDICSLFEVACNATERRETIGFNGDRFVGVGLEQTRCQEDVDLDVWNVEHGDLEELQVTKLIVNSPSDFAMAFDL